jgi:chromosome segregation ATPase
MALALMLQDLKQERHKLTIRCTELEGVVRMLSQDVEQDQQQLQDVQSRAGAAQETSRKQTAQISRLTAALEESRRRLEAVEQERDDARVQAAALSRRRQGDGDAVAAAAASQSGAAVAALEEQLGRLERELEAAREQASAVAADAQQQLAASKAAYDELQAGFALVFLPFFSIFLLTQPDPKPSNKHGMSDDQGCDAADDAARRLHAAKCSAR